MRGIVMRGADLAIVRRSKAAGLAIEVRADWSTGYDRTLFITEGVRVPWELVPQGFEFLDRWEVAAPIWRYDTLADDVAGGEGAWSDERERTEAVAIDLRVPLYAHELLFVRESEGGTAFLDALRDEVLTAGPSRESERLAFLRALCRVKPLFVALPRSWLGTDRATRAPVSSRSWRRQPETRSGPLVSVEVSPGVSVKCYAGDEETVRRQYAERRSRATKKERRRGQDKERGKGEEKEQRESGNGQAS